VGRPRKINALDELWACKLDRKESAFCEALAKWLARHGRIEVPTRSAFVRFCIMAYSSEIRKNMKAGKVPPLFE
jgi:hypothetical protein